MQKRAIKNIIPALVALVMVVSMFMGYLPIAMSNGQQHSDMVSAQPLGDNASSTPAKLVIGFVYFGTDNASSCTNSFVEIYNPNDFTVELTDVYALQYKSMAPSDSPTNYTPDWIKLDLIGEIPAHSSFLVNFGPTGAVPNSTVGRLDLRDKTFDQDFVFPAGTYAYNKGVKLVITSNQDQLPSDLKNPYTGDGAGQVARYVDMFGISGNDTSAPSVDGYETACLLAGDGMAQSKQKGFVRMNIDTGIKYQDTDNNLNDFQQVDFRTSDLTNPALVPRSLEDGPWVDAAFSPEDLTLTPGSDQSAINFTWYSDNTDNMTSVVEVSNASYMVNGLFPDNPAISVVGTVGDASAGKSWHKAEVTGLDPNTQYVYHVSNDGTLFSDAYSFKTGPVGDFQFIAVGDPQLNHGAADANSIVTPTSSTTAAGWQNTLNLISQYFPNASFIAGTGDQVDTSTNEDQYTDYFAPSQLRSLPVAPAVGNHEGTDPNFEWHFNLPNETAGEYFGNYWYSYNNALFVVLNNSAYPATEADLTPYISVMDQTLAAATAANPNAQWLFVQIHKSPASPATHQSDSDVLLWSPAIETLMDKYNVDIVFAGHDHVYSRSWSIYDGQIEPLDYSQNYAVNPEGTTYFTLNTASGLKYYDFPTSPLSSAGPGWVSSTAGLSGEDKNGVMDLSGVTGKPWYTNVGVQDKTPQFSVVDVTSGSVTVTTYRTDTMAVVDQYTIYKTNDSGSGSSSGISLDKTGTQTLSAMYGYSAQMPVTVTVTNNGDQSSSALTISLSGADAGSFNLSATAMNSIAAEGNDTFTVVPNTGLVPKTYTATVTVTDGNSVSESFNVAFTVGKGMLAWNQGTVEDKVYDGNTSATISKAPTLIGVVGNDTVSVVAGTASFADKNAGDSKAVIASGWSISGGQASYYSVGQPSFATASIAPKTISFTGTVAATKADNGNQNFSTSNITVNNAGSFNGKVSGDDVALSDAGVTGTLAAGAISGNLSLSGTFSLTGADAKNYVLSGQPTVPATITDAASGTSDTGGDSGSNTVLIVVVIVILVVVFAAIAWAAFIRPKV